MNPNQRCSIMVGVVMLVASCATPGLPITNVSGTGIAPGSTLSFLGDEAVPNDLRTKTRTKIESYLIGSGYRVQPASDYVIEYSISQRSPAIGVFLPSQNMSEPEAGSWRSRPIDPKIFSRCRSSIYRLMVVVYDRTSGGVVFRGSGDDEACEQISDEKLGVLVSSFLSKLSTVGAQ